MAYIIARRGSGHRVRQGILPELDNQVDVSHETWCHGRLTPGDFVMSVEGWVNYPPGKARWYAPDLPIQYYTTMPTQKIVGLTIPAAYKFASSTIF